MKRLHDLAGVLAGLGPGATVVLHTACAEPLALTRELADRAPALVGLNVVTMMPMGQAPYSEPGPASQLRVAMFFPGKGLRAALRAGLARPLRHPLSAVAGLFDSGAMHADAVLLQVSPPDETGHVTLGLSVDYMRAVLAQSPLVVAEINPRMPRTRGDTRLPAAAIDWFVDAQAGPQEVPPAQADAVDQQIARHVAGLVRDGAVLQVGIGSLPDCVLGQLGHLKHLGLHSGVITSPVQPLIESGVIDNSTKKRFRGVGVTAMACGTQAFYEFLDGNAGVEFHVCSLTHGAAVLEQIDGLCAINSALQVDLAGNINAETVAGQRISMPGGLPDFAAGARRAKGGVSIVALRSTFGKQGASNIVTRLDAGSPATVTARDVDFVVTEHGVAALHGGSARQRGAALIAVAHPDHREALEREFAAAGSGR